MIYFNNAADSYPKPLVIQEVINGLPYMEISRICNCKKDTDMVSLLRSKLKKFLNLPDHFQVTLTNSATEAANLVIQSFYKNRQPDDAAGYDIKSHNCIIRPIVELYPNKHYFSKCDGFQISNFQFYSLPLMSNVNGEVIDIRDVIYILNRRGSKIPLVIDISQAIGNINIDVSDWGYYENLYLFGTFHKSMMSISGCGFLIHPVKNQLKPLIYGGTGTDNDDLKQPREYPFYLESGTKNMLAIAAAIKSIDAIDGLIEENSKIKKNLVEYFVKRFNDTKDDLVDKYFDLDTDINYESGIVNILTNNSAIGESIVVDLSEKYKIITRFGKHCSPLFTHYSRKFNTMIDDTIRISFSPYNTIDEIDCFFESFHDLLLEKEIQLTRK